MPAAPIFISYRRDDTAGYARAVYDALAREFGDARVFIDVDDIGAGQTFDDAIAQAVGDSVVLLVLIGPRWLAARGGGAPRLHDEQDFVRREVAAGLARGMRVIPLLFDGAEMPTAAQLPDPLRPLARHQALVIDAGRFAADIERLVAVLRDALGERTRRWRPALVWTMGASLALTLAGLGGWLAWSGGGGGAPAAGQAAAARPAINGRWQARVVYDWPNADYLETFEFSGEAAELQGSASFLRVARGIVEGRVGPDGLRFVTRSREMLGSDAAGQDVTHRYQGRLVGAELHLVMQTEGGSSTHPPVRFVARRE